MPTIQQLQDTLTAAQSAFTTAQSAATAAQQAVYDAQVALDTAVAAGLQSGSVGTISTVTQLLLTERDAGITAAITYIQANPSCALADAVTAWTTAALAATGLPSLLQDPNLLCTLYAGNLAKEGALPDTTWTSLAAWIVATPAATIAADMA